MKNSTFIQDNSSWDQVKGMKIIITMSIYKVHLNVKYTYLFMHVL